MVAIPIWRIFFLLLSVSTFNFIFYEDSQYKHFGFRYWLGLVACIWLNFVTLASYFIAFTGGSIMVYNQYKMPLVVIFLFLPFVKSIKVFDEKYFESRNPNMEIILFWTKV
ncbi:TPA: MFS transporter [Streptococcus suis]